MPSTRTFTRDQLDALGLPDDLTTEDDAAVWDELAVELHREQVDTRRWVSVHELIFRAPDDGKTWRVTYEQGLTEHQDDHDPWNYDREVTAVEVEQYDQTVKAWRALDEEHPADREKPRPHPEPTARVLTEDEFDKACRAAVAELGLHAGRIGTYVIESAVISALAAVRIMPPPPDPEPGTCPVQFADLAGEWHQCAEADGHDPAEGHSDGEWSWPHGDLFATPDADDEQAQR
jgi:hypothetical protein